VHATVMPSICSSRHIGLGGSGGEANMTSGRLQERGVVTASVATGPTSL
jgi:hypothetical protein